MTPRESSKARILSACFDAFIVIGVIALFLSTPNTVSSTTTGGILVLGGAAFSFLTGLASLAKIKKSKNRADKDIQDFVVATWSIPATLVGLIVTNIIMSPFIDTCTIIPSSIACCRAADLDARSLVRFEARRRRDGIPGSSSFSGGFWRLRFVS
jgi:hypothetical protein